MLKAERIDMHHRDELHLLRCNVQVLLERLRVRISAFAQAGRSLGLSVLQSFAGMPPGLHGEG